MKILGIAGGSGCGKSHLVGIMEKMQRPASLESMAVIPQDAYYKDCSALSEHEKRNFNFDEPDSLDFDLLNEHLNALIKGEEVERPVYDMVNSIRAERGIMVKPPQLLIVEGILLFTQKNLLDLFNLTVYLDLPVDIRLIRIIRRDMEQRGRTAEEVMRRYERCVRPMHEKWVEPSKSKADLVLDSQLIDQSTVHEIFDRLN
jgi:uridine kinase